MIKLVTMGGSRIRISSFPEIKIKHKMICIKTNIPKEVFEINDELKAIYHSSDSICIWIFKSRIERNKFMDETIGMLKKEREDHYISNYK